MNNPFTLNVTAGGDRDLIMTRSFKAPRRLVYEAFVKPELVKRWLAGPPGWTMTVCELDVRPGGSYRYEWQHEKGHSMGMGGVYREVVPPERIVQTEKFDQSWYPGEATGTLLLTEKDGITTMVNTVTYESREARDGVLKSPMEKGVALGYNRMEEMLVEMVAA